MLYDFRMAVLESVPFHVLLWIMIIVGLVGNFLVIMWRCTLPRPQRGSVLSIAIIILAVADFFYCVHLIMIEGYVAKDVFGGLNPTPSSATVMIVICQISGNLSLVTCSTAMWMTLNIAIYSFQALTGRNCCCDFCCNCCCSCCSLVDRKLCLCRTIVCQLLTTTLPMIITGVCLTNLVWSDIFPGGNPTTSEFLTSCASAQTTGFTTFDVFYGAALATINTSLSVSCAILYLIMCTRLNRQILTSANFSTMQGVRELTNLKRRLTLIVLLSGYQ